MFRSDVSWQHCRFHWVNASGRRALFAVYNDETGLWHCWISGIGMIRHDFIACSQSGAISQALCISARWSLGWKLQNFRKTLYRLWDGIPDVPRVIPRHGYQFDLFLASAPTPEKGGGQGGLPPAPSGGPRDLYVPVTRKVSLKNETRTLQPGACS